MNRPGTTMSRGGSNFVPNNKTHAVYNTINSFCHSAIQMLLTDEFTFEIFSNFPWNKMLVFMIYNE